MPSSRSSILVLAFLLPALATPARAATVTVDTDGGAGSLRQALAAASDGDTIDFALATPATIALTTGELVVAKSVTITGPGAAALTISGSDASRVFHVSPGKTVTIAHLTVEASRQDARGRRRDRRGGEVARARRRPARHGPPGGRG
jgi:hypothetical protein